MKEQYTLPELMEDLYQIAYHIDQCSNPNKTKFSKDKLKGLESTLQFYMKKYHLPSHPIKKNIESVHYDYTRGINHIFRVLINPMTTHYMEAIQPMFSKQTSYLYKQVHGNMYAYVQRNEKKFTPKKQAKCDPGFLRFVSIEELEKTRKHPISSKEIIHSMKQTTSGSPEMIEVLRKQTEQIIVNLRQTGFLEKLIHDEETRDHIILSRSELEHVLSKPYTDCADQLVLFIFWLNKYIKQLIIYEHYLFPIHIERDILSHRQHCYDPEYIQIYKKLFGVTEKEYMESLQKFISLALIHRDLYKLKDSLLNLLLKIQFENGKSDTLSTCIINHKQTLSYDNPITDVRASFHINPHRMNIKYLQGLKIKKEATKEQSIPHSTNVKKYQKSKFENYI